MRFRSPSHWWPLLVVALIAGCDDDKPAPTGTGGAGGSGGAGEQDGGGRGGTGGAAGSAGAGGNLSDAGITPPGDGGLAPCLDRPTDLDRPPSGRLPCDLLPPGFVGP